MEWICLDCGNNSTFNGWQNGVCYFRESGSFDGTGMVVDTYDLEHEEYDVSEREIETCGECESSNIALMTREEIIEYIREHNPEWENVPFEYTGDKVLRKSHRLLSEFKR